MILRLQHQRPDGEVDSYYLKPGRRFHIGRGSICEIRILDLKLSRKHCALEFGTQGWQVVDLMSTNGCMLNGEQIVGDIPVKAGSVLEAGQTKLTVAAIFDPQSEEPPAVTMAAARNPHKEQDADHDHTATTAPEPEPELEQELLPEGPANAAAKASSNAGNDWEPEPNTEALNKTDALIPNVGGDLSPIPGVAVLKPERPITRPPTGEVRRPTAVFRAEDQGTGDDHDNLATRTHAPEAHKAPPAPVAPPAPIAPNPGADSLDRTFFITVLGRRVGPLTRAAARELKARELKGTLSTTDLEQYPQG